MSKISKNTIITIIVIILIIIGGIIYWTGQQKKEEAAAPGEEQGTPPVPQENEILSLAGEITKVTAEENSIMVKPTQEEREVKVVLSETTEMIQLKFPFEPGEAPTEGTFTPERVPITIADLEVGKSVLIETVTNLAGKTEISDVKRMQVLP